MPRIKKHYSAIIELPEKWEIREKDEKTGEDVVVKTYNIGGGRVRIRSLNTEDHVDIRKASVIDKFTQAANGGMVNNPEVDIKKYRENQFLSRLCADSKSEKLGLSPYWEGFEGPDGQTLNCTSENIRKFAWEEDVFRFIMDEAGAAADAMADGSAEEESKNLLKSLNGLPAGEKESIRQAAKNAAKDGKSG